MTTRVAILLVAALFVAGCDKVERQPGIETGPAPGAAARDGENAGVVAGDDAAVALALLDRGDVPAAIEPLRRAVASRETPSQLSREELDLLLGQARAATSEEFAEERIAGLKDPQFEAFVSDGVLPSVPYFDDERIDGYFRKVLLAKRPQAREIRERRR